MNIFVLDADPSVAAKAQCDKHVVKMVLESAQLLSTAQQVNGNPGLGMYKPTHKNHPCTKWASETYANYSWLYQHFDALCSEYTNRYGKVHKSSGLLATLHPSNFPGTGFVQTPFAQAMPDEYRSEDPVRAYRAYYLAEKRFAEWNRSTPQPSWWK
jgi:hypothetical protein